MGLKPDHWIRKMAREHRMIEPFEDKQVREGVISYGVSSYGYDVRVADEFKIFTNVFSATVDPKNFDTKSMVDFIGDVCIVPPNSFALARTVEYFRIPRKVLTVCLGKSTYARCFRGDTRVALVDGTSPTLEEMTHRAEDGEMFWGYSIGENGRMIVTLLDAPRYVGRDSLVEVTLDNDEKIHCTPDHLFMLRDGRWLAAGELREGTSLMPLYRNLQRGYEMVYQPLNGHLYPTHRLADEWNLRFGVYADQPGTHRHHADFDRLNNNPWNITRMAVGKALNRTGSIRGAARYLNCDRAVFRRFPEVLREFRGQGQNHKVVSVRPLAGDHDVFCLTVPETGNFALESGVIVHNCGIIVNVTPFEPCFSDDTEVLTRDGWILVRDVQVGMAVLGMNSEGVAEWQVVERKQEYSYEGDLIHFGGRNLDLLITPEHKVLARKRIIERKNTAGRYTDWMTMRADELYGRYNFEMLRHVNWQGIDMQDEITFGKYVFSVDAFLELVGLYLGDGSCYVNKGGYLIKLAAFKDREVGICENVLQRLGIRYARTETGFQFFSKELYEFLHPLGHAHEKYIPQQLKDLPPARLERILFGLMNSDGNNQTETYTTVSKRLADDVQEIIHKAGYAAIVRCAGLGKTRDLKGNTIRGNHPVYKVRLSRAQLSPKIGPAIQEKVPYEGMVYDVTVPGHVIFVRRNGKAVWSGNCWEGYVTLEISNTTPLPAKIYANEGLAQVLFFEADEECEISYADKKGKYQKQQSIVLPKL